MKSRILVSVLVTFLILAIFTLILSAGEVKYDFRKTNWGMSREQVRATEDKELGFEDDNMLGYEVTISGKDFVCRYSFLEDKLYESGYIFTGKHTNKNLYIDDYEKLKETLIKKYGKPKAEIVFWSDDLFKNKKQDWGTAVSIGHLSYGDGWETPTTKIELMLWGDNYKINLTIFYESRELEEWAKKIKEEKAKDKF